MKQKNTQKQPSKLELWGNLFSGLGKLLLLIIGLIIFIAVIVGVIKSQIDKSGDDTMSIDEAQTKCMLMEEADMVNLMGEPFGAETTKKAEKHCLSLWDRSKNPNNTDEAFIEMVKTDWETQKTEVLEGYTLEEYYNEYTK